MQILPFLAALVVCSVALAGCADKEPTTTPSTSTSVTTRPTTSSSSPTTSPTNTSVPGPQTVFKNTVKWASPNEQKPMTVPAGAVKLTVTVEINATAAGAYSVAGPANANPYVEIKPPSGDSTKVEFTPASGVATNANTHVSGPHEKTINAPASGAWTITVGGTGNNVHAYVVVVAAFS